MAGLALGPFPWIPDESRLARRRVCAAAALGEIEKVRPLEIPPLGGGFVTVTLAAPTVATSVAGIAASSWELLLKTVGRSTPFHCTPEVVTKSEPSRTRANDGPPGAAEEGDSEDRLGSGFKTDKLKSRRMLLGGVS